MIGLKLLSQAMRLPYCLPGSFGELCGSSLVAGDAEPLGGTSLRNEGRAGENCRVTIECPNRSVSASAAHAHRCGSGRATQSQSDNRLGQEVITLAKQPLSVPRLRVLWAAAALILLPAAAFACSVPVFRFALEQWRPDAYQVFIYHDQDLSAEHAQLVERLQREGSASGGANLQVRLIDLRGELQSGDRERLEQTGVKSLPQIVVNLPRKAGDSEVLVGAAELTEQEVQRLVNSPARMELAKRLIDGEVVWVFLSGEDAGQDDARLTALETELAGLQETLKLPAIQQEDLKELSVAPEELKIGFSALRVDRNDPAEKWLVQMLLSTEPDLKDDELAGQPMAFPIFGRGRTLYALVGMGINAHMIKEAAEFLTGPCQCTVKAENPGVDLLLPVRWDDYIVPTEPEEVALPLVGLGGYEADAETGLPIIAARQSLAATTGADDLATEEGFEVDPLDAPVLATSLAQVVPPLEPVERSALTVYLPWIVMILLGLIVTIASLSFFRGR